MSTAAMVIAGVAIGIVAGRLLLPLVWSFKVRDSRSLRVMVPLSTAAALGAAGGLLGTTWDVIPVWALFVALVAVTTVDLFHYRIPNAIVFPAVLVLLALMTLISLLRHHPGVIGQAVAAAGLYGGIMAVLHTASRGSLGWGDVKLSLPLGLVLGWVGSGYGQSLLAVLLALGLASVLGAIMGLFVWGVRALGIELLPDPLADPDNPRPTVFPFAPSMAVAAAAVALAIPVTS
ncbi:prepilin peptidase [Candidatus Poriferisocius sp.]|uniref:prepilin peptidase n=1 Tax=Candidatus Poriferisocius sp. TaxID=3101276 RepID=UPI003B028E5C